jgi:hypothetical protein
VNLDDIIERELEGQDDVGCLTDKDLSFLVPKSLIPKEKLNSQPDQGVTLTC